MATTKMYSVDLSCSDPYKAGQSIDAAEAEALNDLRAERCSHILRSWIKSKSGLGIENPTDELVAPHADAVIAKFKELTDNYEFTLGSGRTSDPVERAAKEIAREQCDMALRAQGLTKAKRGEEPGEGEVSHAAYIAKVAEIAALPEVIKRAEQIVKTAQMKTVDVTF